MATLEIRDLHVTRRRPRTAPRRSCAASTSPSGSGETHAIMGPNGSGKSTLAYSIAGHPKYTVTGGTVTLDGEDVLAMTVDERARAGLFLAMQYPVEVPGVTVSQLPAHRQDRDRRRGPASCAPGSRTSRRAMADLRMDPAFAERNVNEGFSGGEKKRHEILQMELLKPKIAILDETDSGLDVDALQGRLRGRQPGPGRRRGRRAADHALHADPALHQARLRARLRRRPDRRGGRPRAGRPPRGRGLRPLPSAPRPERRRDRRSRDGHR